MVVGGGITGAGIALDLALRGVRLLLVERGDWAGATSSASSRLVHGGLRYLEQFELGLVRESCLERALLLENAAGLVWPETFLFPVHRGDRVGRAKLGLGLALYQLLSVPRPLGVPGLLGPRRALELVPGLDAERLRGGGHYQDGATDDARLTLAVVASAARAGALVLSRFELRALEAGASGASLELQDVLRGTTSAVRTRAVVLAGGPFTEALRARAGLSGTWITPTRGSHVVVPRVRLPTDGAVIFPSRIDGRVMFLIPWPRYTILGTTDLDADPAAPVQATRAEVSYLLESANALVPHAELTPADVVSTWAGLRPLLAAAAAPSERSREERIEREGPVYTIAGGKLTGFRSLAEKVSARLCEDLALGRRGRRSPTRTHALCGALAGTPARPLWSRLDEDGLPEGRDRPLVHAWSKRYAAHAPHVRAACDRLEGGNVPLDAETLVGEVDWAVGREDCLGLSDFLFRRTDLGYGPAKVLRAALPRVEERMAELLGWREAEKSRQRSELDADLGRIHAWRDEPL